METLQEMFSGELTCKKEKEEEEDEFAVSNLFFDMKEYIQPLKGRKTKKR